jgi:hypothetical protein
MACKMSRYLRIALLAGALGGCASDAEPGEMAICYVRLIEHSLIYSAFDGVHEFSVTPNVPSARADSLDSDPVQDGTLRWRFDPAFFSASAFPELPGAVKLTAKQAGTTEIEVIAETVSGVTVSDTAKIIVAQADPNVWSIGDARYRSGVPASWGNFPLASAGEGSCGLPYTIDVPAAAACVSCHDNSDKVSAEYTPTQTAGHSDEDLLNIMLAGSKPAGGAFISPQLTAMQQPDCIFGEFHTFEMTPLEQQGLITRLRAVPPRAIE